MTEREGQRQAGRQASHSLAGEQDGRPRPSGRGHAPTWGLEGFPDPARSSRPAVSTGSEPTCLVSSGH